MTQTFDAIIIGAGQAGPSLAGRLTAAGMSIALIERKLFGGTCVNTGCTPTKALVASAHAAHVARRAAEYGVMLQGAPGIDMAAVKARTDKSVIPPGLWRNAAPEAFIHICFSLLGIPLAW
jgi:pyruvate/2-oxoglutarate dehydrogenase complex dihydrolipoamide dehydrogenase (E3) component